MISKVYAIYDNKACFYLNPLFFNSRGESIRNFSDAVNDTQTMLHRHPADFQLFELGTYNNETAEIRMFKSAENLGCAIEFLVDKPKAHEMPLNQPDWKIPTNGA